MGQVTTRNRNKRQQFNKTDMLINEMQKRKKACLMKMQKLSDRINILEGFKNQTSGRDINLQEYLKTKGYDCRQFFAPMGYYTPNNMVVSADAENKALTYHQGMGFNKNVGYHIPNREVVSEKDHQEITSSMYGMTWNPALMHYYPTTVFDTDAYSSAEGMGDTGMDMVGGLRMEDFAKLTNRDEDSIELTSMVQGLLEEEYDNVEAELELIEDAEMQLYGQDSSFEGEDAQKVQSGKNLACRTKCATKHAFNRSKREECEKQCDDEFKASQKQEGRRGDREDRKTARDEFRADKKSCKARLSSGELQKWQYKECLKKERKDKRSDIKEAGGNFAGRGLRGIAKVNPFLAVSRGGVLILVGENTWGFSTRLAPALLPDAEARELFKLDAIVNAKKGWEKVKKAYKNLGGDSEKLKNKIIEGYKKKPYKISRKESFDGESFYEYEEISNFTGEPVSSAVLASAIAGGAGVLTSLIGLISKVVEKNPYKEDKTPEDYKKALQDGSVESNPPIDVNSPIVNTKGEWVEPSTGKAIDPVTGKYKDDIFGLNKWVAVGIGVVTLFALYSIFKSKK
jgi:hypothetical protein